MPSILFVCLGNICRSPTAEAVFRTRCEAAGLDVTIDSAGTGNWHAGALPDKRARTAGERRGYSFAGQRARQVTREDFQTFDYILAMDRQNLADLEDMKPADFEGVLDILLRFQSDENVKDVPDPYYGSKYGFENVLSLIETACDGLIRTIKERHSAHD